MGSEAVPSGVLTLAESDIAPQAGAPPLEGYDLGFEPTKEDCLLVIDLQVDFMPGGALEVPGGTEVFPLVNAMIEKFECVVMSQDWHPPAHSSFASQHEGKAPYDVTSMPYGEQTLWPDHCVQGTSGARFHADLSIPERARVCRKGFRKHVDSYSAFFENDHVTATGLEAYLKSEGVKRVFVVGVAYDFCVRYSCEDAAKAGFESVLVKDATRAVGLPGSVEAADRGVVEAGVRTANSGGLAAVAR